eukprot:465704-Pleurochrysis_carterae.AAC.1
MSTCSFLPSIAKRESAPLPTGDSNTNCPPCGCAAMAIRVQFVTIVFARTTVAGSPPSCCGTPIGCTFVRSTCGAPGSNRAADHVEHGGEATTAMQSTFDASSIARSATSSRA